MFTASAVMWVGSRNVYMPHMPCPWKPGWRRAARADTISIRISAVYATSTARIGQAHGCSKPSTVYPRMLKTEMDIAKLRSALYRGSLPSMRGLAPPGQATVCPLLDGLAPSLGAVHVV